MGSYVALGTPKGTFFPGDTVTGASVVNGGTATVNGWTIDTAANTDLRAMVACSAIGGSGVTVQPQESADGANWLDLGSAAAISSPGLSAIEPANFGRFVRFVLAEAGSAGDSGTVAIVAHLKGD